MTGELVVDFAPDFDFDRREERGLDIERRGWALRGVGKEGAIAVGDSGQSEGRLTCVGDMAAGMGGRVGRDVTTGEGAGDGGGESSQILIVVHN
jgi:hypothetical protein